MPTKLEISDYFTQVIDVIEDAASQLELCYTDLQKLTKHLREYQRDHLGKRLTKTSQKT